MPWWKSVAREPLVHFIAIGAVLFAVDAARGGDEHPAQPPSQAAPTSPAAPPTVRAPIVIDAEVRTQIAAAAERRLGRPPAPAELVDETERWIDEEVLYREAIARGLDRHDPVVHQRFATQLLYALEQAAIVPEPSEAELRAHFDAHRERWSRAEHVDFTHVFVSGNDAAAAARADELAAALAAGAAPERLGDRFSGGHRYRGRRITDLAQAFGETFVDSLPAQTPGAWVRRTSRHGIHLVRLDRVEAASAADFERARLDVRKEWMDARRAADVRAAVARLREGWTIEQR